MNRPQILAATIAAIASVNCTIAIDISGSMNSMMPNPIKGQTGMISRINAVKTICKPQVTTACAYDQDGLDAVTFDSEMSEVSNLTLETFDAWWNTIKAGGSTYLASTITKLGERSLARLSTGKIETIYIFTDGAPGDKKATAEALIKVANDARITADGQIGITFVRIGAQDGVSEWLTELDENLKANRDIVSWCTLEQFAELSYETAAGYCTAGSFDASMYEEALAAGTAAG